MIRTIIQHGYRGGTNNGVGETITINTDPTKPIYALLIANGYFKSEDAYFNNGKVKKVTVYTYEQEQSFELNTFTYFGVTDDMKPAYSDMLIFSEPLYTSQLTIALDDTVAGSKYTDICVSDVFVLASKHSTE